VAQLLINSKIESVGVPVPNVHVKIMDIETGTKEKSLGESGEIFVAGPQVMLGYHNNHEAIAETMAEMDGKTWMKTGIGIWLTQKKTC